MCILNTFKMNHTSPFLRIIHICFFLTKKLEAFYTLAVFRLNDVVTFVVSMFAELCWYSRFLSPCPFSLMATTVGKKTVLSGTELFTSRCVSQVCFHTLYACVYVSQPNSPPLRWTKYGSLDLIQRFDQASGFETRWAWEITWRDWFEFCLRAV